MTSPILVFAKAPEPGKVKTRLVPLLGADGAAALHRDLVRHALATANSAGLGPVELWCAPDERHPFFAACAQEFGIALKPQGEGDLGARMLRAFEATLGQTPRALLIGSDCPSLTSEDLRNAACALETGNDAVFTPAEDGGYMLVGLTRAAPELFEGVAWGTPMVMAETRKHLSELGWHWQELPTRWDVDRPEDYARLVREGLLPGLVPFAEAGNA
ncbi:MAG: TIGR04282 family arsenosugar biosynthesis glycosyltransferase [Betaproteobacteria bacterium]|nr:TIGR04282 family arsenosugar biosynthesis glycosyltransferase [Betaproteobacteria bacterium]